MSPTPLEPLYTLKQAAALIPFVSVDALSDWLYKHRHEFGIRTMPFNRRELRVLTLSELQRIRGARVKHVRAPLPLTALQHRHQAPTPGRRPRKSAR